MFDKFNVSNFDAAVPNVVKSSVFDHVFENYGNEIKVVLHVASPFFFDTTEYEKDLLHGSFWKKTSLP